jgi:hypothetical protein
MTELGALSGPLAGVSFITGLATGVALASNPYPRPGATPEQIQRYFSEDARSARISAVGQLVSAASLGRFTASVARLAGRSGRGARALQATSLLAGGAACASLAASGLGALALTGRPGRDTDTAVAIHRGLFTAGGPVHTASFGALVVVLSVAGRRTGTLPRSLAATGVASGVAGALSLLYFVAKPAAWFVPAGRFSGLIVAGVAGARLACRADKRQ